MTDPRNYPHISPQMHAASQRSAQVSAMREAARNSGDTAEGVAALLAAAAQAEERERRMLRWAVISGIAAIAAAVLALVAIVVTIAVS